MRAKKHFGQNFLKSEKIVERMVGASEVSEKDTVLEIGPGKGILTKALLKAGATVVVIEKDTELIPFLESKFKEETINKKLSIIEADILNIDVEEIIKSDYKIVANIPYYITGEIIRKFLTEEKQPTLMTLLVQKEVARRIVASDKKESILSLSVKLFGTPSISEVVKRTMFTPAPNVDSAVLVIKDISIKNLKEIDESKFFNLVKLGFSQKRKQFLSNIKELNKNKTIDSYLKNKNIPLTVRAEDIDLQTWIEMAKILNKY